MFFCWVESTTKSQKIRINRQKENADCLKKVLEFLTGLLERAIWKYCG
jgi:hypothetical protein